MRKFILLTLLALAPFLALAVNIPKSGQKVYHNYITLHQWRFDSLRVATNDIAIFYLDSATASPFTLASLGVVKSNVATEFDQLPDSIGFVLETFGDASDATRYAFDMEVTFDKTNWYALAGAAADTISITNGSLQMDRPNTRRFIPNAWYRCKLKTTDATDITRVRRLLVFPIWSK